MTIEKTITDKEIIVKIGGWLDAKTAPELYDAIFGIEPEGKVMVFDLEDLEYISSAGIRQIMYGYKKMNGDFLLKNVRDSIIDILKSIGLDKKIKIQ